MFCMALLDSDEESELRVSRLGSRAPEMLLLGLKPSLRGEDLPPWTEVERGGRSDPLKSPLAARGGAAWERLPDCLHSGSSVDKAEAGSKLALLVVLACREFWPLPVPEPGAEPLPLAVRCRSRCCFFFRPYRRLMMMSRMRGRKRSRLACDASWLSVSSRMERNRSGTGPRSWVSTPILLKARQAMLNS